jgi:polysaccharide export outer membrane protein
LAKIAFIVCTALALGACALPRSGPSLSEFAKAGQANAIQLVDATVQDAAASRDTQPAVFPPAWKDVPATTFDRIGAGDVVRVVIFEHDGLGVFAAGQDGHTTLDSVPVDPSGMIQIPFVGQVHVAGLSLGQARSLILSRMRGLVASADVQVSFAERHSQLVSVQGDVAKPGAVALTPETSRLTSLLSVAAPAPADLEQATVTVRRGVQSATVRLADVFERPANDIPLSPGDIVVVRNVVQSVNVLGSAGLQGRVRVTKPNFTVMDAVAESRGLDNEAANASAVYLMQMSDKSQVTAATPKVYRFNFRNPAQLAVASSFVVHDGDVIYISTAPFTQTRQVLSALTGVLNTARSASVVAP